MRTSVHRMIARCLVLPAVTLLGLSSVQLMAQDQDPVRGSRVEETQPDRGGASQAGDDAGAQSGRRQAGDDAGDRGSSGAATRTQGRTTQGAQAGRSGGAQQMMQGDQALVAWLTVDNNNEVAQGQLASERAQNPEVKAFAQRMVQEHTQYLQRLQQVAEGGQGGPRPQSTSLNDPTANPESRASASASAQDQQAQQGQPGREAQSSQARTASAGAGASDGQGQINFVQLKQELGQQCLASSMRALEEKQGAEFDKAYVGMQKYAHMQMLDTLNVFKQHASAELQQVINEGIQSTQAHLDHAKQLMQQLESKPGGNQAGAQQQPQQPQQK